MAKDLKGEHQRPEGRLIEAAMKAKRLTARGAAKNAAISDGWWRQIVNGYVRTGGTVVPIVGADDTLARMARVVGVTPQQLREAGRPEAADVLLTLSGMQAESEWQSVGTALDRLLSIREQIDGVIADAAQVAGPDGRFDAVGRHVGSFSGLVDREEQRNPSRGL